MSRKNIIKENLSEKEQQTVKKLGKRNTLKLIKKMTQAYNAACQPCKHLMVRNPKRPLEEYCEDCQEIIKQKLGDVF